MLRLEMEGRLPVVLRASTEGSAPEAGRITEAVVELPLFRATPDCAGRHLEPELPLHRVQPLGDGGFPQNEGRVHQTKGDRGILRDQAVDPLEKVEQDQVGSSLGHSEELEELANDRVHRLGLGVAGLVANENPAKVLAHRMDQDLRDLLVVFGGIPAKAKTVAACPRGTSLEVRQATIDRFPPGN